MFRASFIFIHIYKYSQNDENRQWIYGLIYFSFKKILLKFQKQWIREPFNLIIDNPKITLACPMSRKTKIVYFCPIPQALLFHIFKKQSIYSYCIFLDSSQRFCAAVQGHDRSKSIMISLSSIYWRCSFIEHNALFTQKFKADSVLFAKENQECLYRDNL